MSAAVSPRLVPLGDAALVCELPPPATLAAQQKLWALANEAVGWEGVRELLPGMNNLALVFDPGRVAVGELAQRVTAVWPTLGGIAIEGRRIEIPVVYGGQDGPDLARVAAQARLTPAEVARRHSAAEYTVFFLGFLPGFAVLGGLPTELATPRRSESRLLVPAGSVGIGGRQTGVYPIASPGTWQLIGRTAITLLDPQAESPTLLRPGDEVRFVVECVAP